MLLPMVQTKQTFIAEAEPNGALCKEEAEGAGEEAPLSTQGEG